MNEVGQKIASVKNRGRLADAVRETRNAVADREDVVVDMREASHMRLELLAQELQPVFDEVPAEDPAFDFVISSGQQPRLWVDAVAHVTMGPDRRTYRFLRDTRLGRVVLAESTDINPVADQVTRYIAERLVERQRMIEGEVFVLPRGEEEDDKTGEMEVPEPRQGGFWRALFGTMFLVVAGAAVGIASVMFFLSDRFPELRQYLDTLVR